jgi:hypothetical protein
MRTESSRSPIAAFNLRTRLHKATHEHRWLLHVLPADLAASAFDDCDGDETHVADMRQHALIGLEARCRPPNSATADPKPVSDTGAPCF